MIEIVMIIGFIYVFIVLPLIFKNEILNLFSRQNGSGYPKKTTLLVLKEQSVHKVANQSHELHCKAILDEVKEYEDKFLRRVDVKNRKQICIGGRTYEKLSEKVFAMGGRKASIGGFIECLLDDHFKQYDALMEQVENNRKKQLSDD